MKKTFFAAFIAIVLVTLCTGCDKKKSTTIDNFVGTYNLVIDYDAFMDGELDESDTFEGTLTITAIDKSKVKVEGVVSLKGTEVMLYETTGVLNDKGMLQLSPSTYSAGAYIFDITYDNIVDRSPLTFTSTMTTEIQGYEVFYDMSNIATKN